MSSTDKTWMRRAIELAVKGRGRVEPNPMVGCVVVRGGRAIGQGWHERFGGAHAEPNALASSKTSTIGATVYVNLEPCCHTEKKTPPCVPALIAAGVSRVVIGCLDPNKQVHGHGVEQLRGAGISVKTGVLEDQCKQLNAAYFASVLHQRPYVTLKWAQSADGKVAGPGGKRLTISGPASLKAMHGLRSRCDAIMVALPTVVADDPTLTARGVKFARPLLRVVLDRQLRLPVESKLVRTARTSPVMLVCTLRALRGNPSRAAELARLGVEVVATAAGRGKFFGRLFSDLHGRGVTHLLVEPGPRLAQAFFEAGVVDRVWVFASRRRVGDETAPSAQKVPYRPVARAVVGQDVLTEYLNPASDVYFAPVASADLGGPSIS